MYTQLLILHSYFRWVVLILLLVAIFKSYVGWKGNKPYTKLDNAIRHWTATVLHIQLVLGLVMYFTSPIVSYFLDNFLESMKEREVRFFGMEHSFMMVLSVIVITIGSMKSKRKKTDAEKFKTMFVYFAVGLFIIFTSIPWEFSPLVSRPSFRGF